MKNAMSVNSIRSYGKITSVKLAEISGRRHDNLVRDIEKMCANAKIALLTFEERYFGEDGSENKMYNLSPDLVLFVISKFDDRLRWEMINRLKVLEDRELIRLDKANEKLRRRIKPLEEFKDLHEIRYEDNDNYKVLTITLKEVGENKSIKVGRFRATDFAKAKYYANKIKNNINENFTLEEKKIIVREEMKIRMGYINKKKRQTLDQYCEELKVA